MTKTIVLTDLVINSMILDYVKNCVEVTYSLVTDTGQVGEIGSAIFWVAYPEILPDPFPDNWFLLPPSYIPTLVGLRVDADTALTNKFLVEE